MGDVKNLTSTEAVEKLKEIIKDTKTCLFVTRLQDVPLAARPMSSLDVDDDGNIYFFSKAGSEKNVDIEADEKVQLFYSNNSGYEYLSVYGKAEILKDRELAHDLWTPIAKTWFNEGKDDPTLTIIKVIPHDAYYWDTKSNKLVSLVKILAGAVTGNSFDDSVQGFIKV
ncbi:pyridoxamine 5'-phosphate oxidase family protein [Foetidibacter luteolus]|uniref:pyridoxamine 5'-phosphate oxidase family protein n=1 Tax=Foetidibacter luteolus TaxID=2608880 RepID=UPI00129B6AC5|nr:pyridoxamine 5'-phosphate oxidase family protein [Foetidibacter luteolus]